LSRTSSTPRGPRWKRSADIPLTTSPLDAFINPVRASIQPRAYGLKNRDRINRRLMLVQLHANRQDDERAYVRQIREILEANQGRPSNRAPRDHRCRRRRVALTSTK